MDVGFNQLVHLLHHCFPAMTACHEMKQPCNILLHIWPRHLTRTPYQVQAQHDQQVLFGNACLWR